MRSRLITAAILLASLALNLCLSTARGADEAKQPPSLEDVQGAIPLLASPDKAKRLEATRVLFKQDRQVLDALKKGGATNATVEGLRGFSDRRLDMVYTLIIGLPATSDRYAPKSFGLIVEKDTTREMMLEMGKKHGFRVNDFNASHYPSCWVELTGNASLAVAMRDVLLNEPNVVTVRLNYVERSQAGAR